MGRRLIAAGLALAFAGSGCAMVLAGHPGGGAAYFPASVLGLLAALPCDWS